MDPRRIPSTTGHVEPRGKLGGPSSKPKYYLATDSEPVPRGKGEKNPSEGSEIDLKPFAYIQWELYGESSDSQRVTAYLLFNGSASYSSAARLSR